MTTSTGRGQGAECVVTGLGVVSPVGSDVPTFWDAQLTQRSGTRLLESDWLERGRFRSRLGAPTPRPDLERRGYRPKDLRFLDLVTVFALEAAHQAVESAGLATAPRESGGGLFSVDGVDPARAGVVMGTGMGGLGTLEACHSEYLENGGPRPGSALRFGLPALIPNAPAAQASIRFGFENESKAIATACAAGTMAIGDAAQLIESGRADVVLAGGAEATLSDRDGLGLMGFDCLRCLSTRHEEPAAASRPFDAERSGFVLGEGAAVLVLERAEHAAARGARALARVIAHASLCDAWSMLQPAPEGRVVARLLGDVVERAGLSPSELGWVNAHATATRAGDVAEATAMRRAFGDAVDDLPVSGTKGTTGHAIAASGAFEAVASVLALEHGLLPPTANLDEVDPECALDHVVGAPREVAIRTALTASYGFGGHDAALVLAKP